MATEKQIKMLLARAREAGVKADWADFIYLSNGEIDGKLAEYAKITAYKGAKSGEVELTGKPNFNDMRFGMCCKIVANQRTLKWCIEERQKFASEVLSLYQSVTYASQIVKEKASEDVVICQ